MGLSSNSAWDFGIVIIKRLFLLVFDDDLPRRAVPRKTLEIWMQVKPQICCTGKPSVAAAKELAVRVSEFDVVKRKFGHTLYIGYLSRKSSSFFGFGKFIFNAAIEFGAIRWPIHGSGPRRSPDPCR